MAQSQARGSRAPGCCEGNRSVSPQVLPRRSSSCWRLCARQDVALQVSLLYALMFSWHPGRPQPFLEVLAYHLSRVSAAGHSTRHGGKLDSCR